MEDSTLMFRGKNITYGDIRKHQGKKLCAIAEAVGISGSALGRKLKKFGVYDDFITSRDVSEYGPDLIKCVVDCMNPNCEDVVSFKHHPDIEPDTRRFCPQCKRQSNWYEEEAQLPRC